MHEKIDRMAGYLSKLTAARTIQVEPSPEHQVESGAAINEGVIQASTGEEQATPQTFKVI
jgi:hypothetical protein